MRPSFINPFEDKRGIVNRAVYVVSLRHVRLVGVHVKELPGGEQCSSKKNGEFSFFSHDGDSSMWDDL
jgi:hypothetical protein